MFFEADGGELMRVETVLIDFGGTGGTSLILGKSGMNPGILGVIGIASGVTLGGISLSIIAVGRVRLGGI